VAEIGNMLREARIRKGLTIKDVESVTKIRSRYLEALEEDDFSVLPGPTFVAGFLRTYAGFLKLDADALVEEYKRNHEPRRAEEQSVLRVEPTTSSRSRRGPAERRKRKTRSIHRGYVFIGVLAVIVVILLAWFGTNWRGQEAATLSPESIPSNGSTTSLAQVSSTTTQPASERSTTTVSAVVSGQNVTLKLAVREGSCWLVIREDSKNGAELYAGTLSAGGQKTFDSSKRYWMRVGNPDALDITINGAVLTLDAAAGSFLVTEAGIQASQ
jgi:cytoskeletal protein RodZ